MQFNQHENVYELNNQYSEALQDLYYGIDVSNSAGIISSKNNSKRKMPTEEAAAVLDKITFDVNSRVKSYQHKKDLLAKLGYFYFYCHENVSILKNDDCYGIICGINNNEHQFEGKIIISEDEIRLSTKDIAGSCIMEEIFSQHGNTIETTKMKTYDLGKEHDIVKEINKKYEKISFDEENYQYSIRSENVNRISKDGVSLQEKTQTKWKRRCILNKDIVSIKDTTKIIDYSRDKYEENENFFVARNNCPSYMLLQPDQLRVPLSKEQYDSILIGTLNPKHLIEKAESTVLLSVLPPHALTRQLVLMLKETDKKEN